MSLQIGEPVDRRVPWIRVVHDLDAAWQAGASGPRQREIERVGKRVRPLLGSAGMPGRFPKAVLVAPRAEWLDWDDLPQCQRAWFVPDGKLGVPLERVVLTDADMLLGEGALSLRTPVIAPNIRPAWLFGKMESGQAVSRTRSAVSAAHASEAVAR